MSYRILTHTPSDPTEAIVAFEGMRRRAEQQLAAATTPADRHDAQFWIDNADRNIDRWRAQLAKAGTV